MHCNIEKRLKLFQRRQNRRAFEEIELGKFAAGTGDLLYGRDEVKL
jgi:hypothetical protein